ncbi:hypothetical protein [Streptomyces sp. JH14]|nr:hypothetical protein [Streptomyces sp. JH14]
MEQINRSNRKPQVAQGTERLSFRGVFNASRITRQPWRGMDAQP